MRQHIRSARPLRFWIRVRAGGVGWGGLRRRRQDTKTRVFVAVHLADSSKETESCNLAGWRGKRHVLGVCEFDSQMNGDISERVDTGRVPLSQRVLSISDLSTRRSGADAS